MQIHTTASPAKLAGERITKSIEEHDGDVLCLLSGGSALDVFEYIVVKECECCVSGSRNDVECGKAVLSRECICNDLTTPCSKINCCKSKGGAKVIVDSNVCDNSECRTIFMMGDERVSREATVNNYLQLTTRYPDRAAYKKLIVTLPAEDEPAIEFATRAENKILEILEKLHNPKIIALFGMGPDGHTAGIFPMNEVSFKNTYPEDGIYVPVYLDTLKIDSRASLTPSFILNHVSESIIYAIGDSKRTMLELLMSETKELHKRPAELFKALPEVHVYTDQKIRV